MGNAVGSRHLLEAYIKQYHEQLARLKTAIAEDRHHDAYRLLDHLRLHQTFSSDMNLLELIAIILQKHNPVILRRVLDHFEKEMHTKYYLNPAFKTSKVLREEVTKHLVFAVKQEDRQCMIILILNGIDCNLKDEHGQTALYYAVEQGADRLVDDLLSAGALGVHPPKTRFKATPLYQAIYQDRAYYVRQILSHARQSEMEQYMDRALEAALEHKSASSAAVLTKYAKNSSDVVRYKAGKALHDALCDKALDPEEKDVPQVELLRFILNQDVDARFFQGSEGTYAREATLAVLNTIMKIQSDPTHEKNIVEATRLFLGSGYLQRLLLKRNIANIFIRAKIDLDNIEHTNYLHTAVQLAFEANVIPRKWQETCEPIFKDQQGKYHTDINSPLTLKACCRFFIHQHMSSWQTEAYETLGLPRSILRYVMFQE